VTDITDHRRRLDERKKRERARNAVWVRLFLAGVSASTIAHVYTVTPGAVHRVLRKRLNEQAAEET